MRSIFVSTMAVVLAMGLVSVAIAQSEKAMPSFAWANGLMYAAVYSSGQDDSAVVKNGLYVFKNLQGQRPVAEAGPGDKNYQGGRWQVIYLDYMPKGLGMFDVNNDGFSEFELTSWTAVQHYMNDLGCFKIVGYGAAFRCPLELPDSLKNSGTDSKARSH